MNVLLLLALALLAPRQDDTPPAPAPVTLQSAQARIQAGDFAGAEVALRALTESAQGDGRVWMLLGYALHGQGKLTEALAVHEKAAGFPAVAGTAAYNAACAHALLGHVDDAFRWLEKARAAGFNNPAQVASDPDLAVLRSDARFAAYAPAVQPVLEGADAFVEDVRVLRTFVGRAPGEEFGWVTRNVGDLDGDGVDDFASTAPSAAVGGAKSGRVDVFSSRTGELLFAATGDPASRLGNSVTGGVDVNGDGTPDVIAGAPGTGARVGEARVYSGRDGALLHAIRAGEPGDAFGLKVAGLEDLDGDGCAELAVGAWQADVNGPDSGSVSVYSGKEGRLLYVLPGERAGDRFGSALDGTHAGGQRLLCVGAMQAGERGTGRCLVYRLGAAGAERLFEIDSSPTGVNLGQYFAALMGDADGDGASDVYVSDWSDAAGGRGAGQVFVHSSRTGERLLAVRGVPGENLGTSYSVAGDANGDGRADLVVGAWQNSSAAPSGGACYLISGADGARLATWTSKQAGDTLGFDCVGVGDADGDGATDFVLSAAWSAVKGPKTGRVFLVAGPKPADAE